jgi:DNA-binding NarL/FixJ family response regulator
MTDVPSTPWSIEDERLVVTCVLRTTDDVARAVHVVSRGGGLIAELNLQPAHSALLFDDLLRLRTDVQLDDPLAELTNTDRALIRLLASGTSVKAAAKALFLSRRTADRRLARLRTIAGASSTREAVLWFSSHLHGP